MYLQEWLSIPVYSLLGINLVGNHEMVEVVDPPESILLFSSFEFFWVRLVRFHPDLQVTVLPLEDGEAHHPWCGQDPTLLLSHALCHAAACPQSPWVCR